MEEIAFMVLAAFWVSGQGMHLSANSIDNLAEALAKKQVIDITGTSIYQLTYFYDEHLSHYMWHIGVLGFAALLIYREWRRPAGILTTWWAATLGGLIYGFAYFCIFLEGQTVVLGLPFALGITLLTLIWGRKKLAQQPILAFFFIACLVAVVLFGGWGVYFGGFPQFSDVGPILPKVARSECPFSLLRDNDQGPAPTGLCGGARDAGQARGPAPTGLSLADVVHRFKTMTTKRYADGVKQSGWPAFGGRLWLRNYCEHIIRNEESLTRIRQYILDNPARWAFDRENPGATTPESESAWRD